MSLSFDEQRRLDEIEERLKLDDPHLAESLDYQAADARRERHGKVARLCLIVGVAVLILGLSLADGAISAGTIVAFYGVVVMVLATVALVRSAKRGLHFLR